MAATLLDVRITDTYLAGLSRLAERSAAAAAVTWVEAGGLSVPSAVVAAEVLPVVSSAQVAAGELALGYLEQMLDEVFDLPDLDPTPTNLELPSRRGWKLLGEGLDQVDAEQSARSLLEDIVHRAAIGGADATHEAMAETAGIVGWRRVPRGDTCSWCRLVSTQRYRSRDSALRARHDRCDCGVVPIIGDRDPGWVINKPLLDELNAEAAAKA